MLLGDRLGCLCPSNMPEVICANRTCTLVNDEIWPQPAGREAKSTIHTLNTTSILDRTSTCTWNIWCPRFLRIYTDQQTIHMSMTRYVLDPTQRVVDLARVEGYVAQWCDSVRDFTLSGCGSYPYRISDRQELTSEGKQGQDDAVRQIQGHVSWIAVQRFALCRKELWIQTVGIPMDTTSAGYIPNLCCFMCIIAFLIHSTRKPWSEWNTWFLNDLQQPPVHWNLEFYFYMIPFCRAWPWGWS